MRAFTLGFYNPSKKGVFPIKTKSISAETYMEAETKVSKMNSKIKNKDSYWKIDVIG